MRKTCISVFVTINSSDGFITICNARYGINISLVRFEFSMLFVLLFSTCIRIRVRGSHFPAVKRSDDCTFPFNDSFLVAVTVFRVTRVKLSLPLHRMHFLCTGKTRFNNSRTEIYSFNKTHTSLE